MFKPKAMSSPLFCAWMHLCRESTWMCEATAGMTLRVVGLNYLTTQLLKDSVNLLEVFFCQYTGRRFQAQVVDDLGMAGQ